MMRTVKRCKRVINDAQCDWWYSHHRYGSEPRAVRHQIKVEDWYNTLVFKKDGWSKREVFLAAADFCERMKEQPDD